MNPTLVTLGIQAVVRLTRAGTDAYAQHARDREVLLHAQQSAAGFYEKSGFKVRGVPFDEVGITHIEMFKSL